MENKPEFLSIDLCSIFFDQLTSKVVIELSLKENKTKLITCIKKKCVKHNSKVELLK